jgi:hypothetical protein
MIALGQHIVNRLAPRVARPVFGPGRLGLGVPELRDAIHG